MKKIKRSRRRGRKKKRRSAIYTRKDIKPVDCESNRVDCFRSLGKFSLMSQSNVPLSLSLSLAFSSSFFFLPNIEHAIVVVVKAAK